MFALIDSAFVQKHGIPVEKLRYPLGLEVADGHLSGTSQIIHVVKLEVATGSHQEAMYLLVTHLAHTPILFGYPWFDLHDVLLRPKEGTVTFDSAYCNKHCQTSPTALRLRYERNLPTTTSPEVVREAPTAPTLRSDPIQCAQISARAFTKFAKRKDH